MTDPVCGCRLPPAAGIATPAIQVYSGRPDWPRGIVMLRVFAGTGVGAAVGFLVMWLTIQTLAGQDDAAPLAGRVWFFFLTVGVVLGSGFGAVYGAASAILGE